MVSLNGVKKLHNGEGKESLENQSADIGTATRMHCRAVGCTRVCVPSGVLKGGLPVGDQQFAGEALPLRGAILCALLEQYQEPGKYGYPDPQTIAGCSKFDPVT